MAAGVLLRMNAAIRHRGPDDEGYLLVGEEGLKNYHGDDTVLQVKQATPRLVTDLHSKIGLGYRRLSIIDLSHCGHQPMVAKDGMVALTFNGEIYNYRELRKELETVGFAFQSQTDTEVILNGYRCWGMEVLQRLNGMFAIALYDAAKQQCWLVRDRLGIKPLFYHQHEEGIYWASEIKALTAAGVFRAQADWQSVYANWQIQATAAPHTAFSNIQALQPGHYMQVDVQQGTAVITKYWDIAIGRKQAISAADAAEELDARLRHIIAQQLVADVPVTTLLSGGVDSTTLTAIAAQQQQGIQAYTLSIDGSGKGLDEVPQAVAMAATLPIRHHIQQLHPEAIVANLDASLRLFEAPYNMLEPVEKAARYIHAQGHKVVMSGIGADEVFGGYSYYLNYPQWRKRQKLAALQGLLPAASLRLQKAKAYLQNKTALQYYLYSRIGMKPYELRMLGIEPPKADAYLQQALGNIPSFEADTEAFFYYDLKHNVGNNHNFREDLSYMGHSVEARYPFLDHELIEWVATLPLSVRYSLQENKTLLRQVAKKYILPQNLAMPKKGFNMPFGGALLQYPAFEQYCAEAIRAVKQRGMLNNKLVDAWWQHREEAFYFVRLWLLITTEKWLQHYID